MRAKLDDVSGTVKIYPRARRGSRYVISLRWRLKKPRQRRRNSVSAAPGTAGGATNDEKKKKKGKSFPRV